MHRFPLYFTMAIIGLLSFSSQAFAAADITLNRNPAPPQSVPADGSGVVAYDFTLVYDSDPDRAEVTVRRPNGTVLSTSIVNLEGQTSPSTGSGLIPIAAGSTPGIYTISVDYYTDTNFGGCGAPGPNNTPNTPTACVEDQAEVNFEVVAIPSLILTKFNDLNRNGVQDAGEPSLANWTFAGSGPNVAGPGVNAGTFTTDTTGRIVLSGLTVNSVYSFTEQVQAGWEVIGSTTQTTTIFAGQTSTLKFANAIIDVCANIAGAQTTVPAGMVQSGVNCVTPPPTDVCPNIDGAQATVPAGMIVVNGNCVTPPPTDVCPNIAGPQGSIPGGFFIKNGQCVPIVKGTATLRSASGCIATNFAARVTGKQIASVTFYIDGKKVKTVYGTSAALTVVPTKYKKGIHRVNAVVTFIDEAQTAPRTLKSTFFRCIKPKPKFTG